MTESEQPDSYDEHPLQQPIVATGSDLREVVLLSLKLGTTAFGGPAAHISMLRNEIVVQRGWTTDQHFLDLVGITSLIPGPNSTEMVIQTGKERAGWPGFVGAGIAFILPATLITGVLAWLYVEYGTTPNGEWLLYAVKPVVVALLLQAIWNLGRTATNRILDLAIVVVAAAAFLAGINEIVILFGGGLAAFGARIAMKWLTAMNTTTPVIAIHPVLMNLWFAIEPTVTVPYSNGKLFLTFLKIGALIWGSGYVLAAFVHAEFVDKLGWLTNEQLLDSVAIGQVTPGPVFSTATFIGYLVGGAPGAILATIAIFLPAFFFVALIGVILPVVRSRPNVRLLLDQINLVSLGLMAGVAVVLARDALVDWQAVMICAAAAVALIRFQLSSTWLLPLAALAGVLMGLIR